MQSCFQHHASSSYMAKAICQVCVAVVSAAKSNVCSELLLASLVLTNTHNLAWARLSSLMQACLAVCLYLGQPASIITSPLGCYFTFKGNLYPLIMNCFWCRRACDRMCALLLCVHLLRSEGCFHVVAVQISTRLLSNSKSWLYFFRH